MAEQNNTTIKKECHISICSGGNGKPLHINFLDNILAVAQDQSLKYC
jgi:hypothetical protein